jgi:hypothetical protein
LPDGWSSAACGSFRFGRAVGIIIRTLKTGWPKVPAKAAEAQLDGTTSPARKDPLIEVL